MHAWCHQQVWFARAPPSAWECLSWDLQSPSSPWSEIPCLLLLASKAPGFGAEGSFPTTGSCGACRHHHCPCRQFIVSRSVQWYMIFAEKLQLLWGTKPGDHVWGCYWSRAHPVQLFVDLWCCWWHWLTWPAPTCCHASGKGSRRGSSCALKADLKQRYWGY